MREIKFKAKVEDEERWVFGDYYRQHMFKPSIKDYGFDQYITYQKRHHTGELWNTLAPIDSDTLSQYTGIDFEESGVFENDLFKWNSTDTDGSEMVVYFRVIFKDGCYYAKALKPHKDLELLKHFILYDSNYENIELLGSIFDFKEHLEVENDS